MLFGIVSSDDISRTPSPAQTRPARQSPQEIYQELAFDKFIENSSFRPKPSYEFWLEKSDNHGKGLYYINLNYPRIPPGEEVRQLMNTMISHVIEHYENKMVCCMVFVNDKTAYIIDGDFSLTYDPETKLILTGKDRRERQM